MLAPSTIGNVASREFWGSLHAVYQPQSRLQWYGVTGKFRPTGFQGRDTPSPDLDWVIQGHLWANWKSFDNLYSGILVPTILILMCRLLCIRTEKFDGWIYWDKW